MLLFSTILSIKDSLDKDGFIKLAISWNQGSPHTENIISNINWNGERNIKYGDDKLWMQIEEYRNQNIIAIRYEKVEDNGIVWDTDYVMNFNEMKMAIRLDRSYMEEAEMSDTAFSTPAFISLLISHNYLENDGDLEITNKPISVDDSNINLVADIINGKKKYLLPVVYISKTFENNNPVDVFNIAKQLKGAAHVLVQEESRTSTLLRELTGGMNEYNGAIGVYFPNQDIGHQKYLRHDYPGSDVKLFNKVVYRVLQFCTAQRVNRLYTWNGVDNALLSDRYYSKREELTQAESMIRVGAYRYKEMAAKNEEYKKIAEQSEQIAEENIALVDSVDEELKTMSQKIAELTKRNDALEAENQGLRARIGGIRENPVLFLGAEDDFYVDEIKNFILGALQDELTNTEPHTRKADVLSDIIRSNGGYKNLSSDKIEEIKRQLRGFKNLSGQQKKALEDLGFVITHDGGHYKMTYYGDARYLYTLASTPSDNRSGLNQATDIIRLVF